MIDLIRRQIELLKLLSKQREYKPASFFSKSLDVSTKTIYTDITYLQSEVEKYKVDLVRAPRIGIRLEGEKENIQHMLRDLQKDNLSEDEKYTPEYRRLWILKKVLTSTKTPIIISRASFFQRGNPCYCNPKAVGLSILFPVHRFLTSIWYSD